MTLTEYYANDYYSRLKQVDENLSIPNSAVRVAGIFSFVRVWLRIWSSCQHRTDKMMDSVWLRGKRGFALSILLNLRAVK